MTRHTDDEVSMGVERAFSTVDMATPLEQIVGRGRRLRTRRRAATGGLLLASTALAVALVLPLTHSVQGGQGSAGRASVTAAESKQAGNADVQMDLAAWSVHTNPDQTVSITVRSMFDPAGLRQTLVSAGIPAVVSVYQYDQPFECLHGTGLPADAMKEIITASSKSERTAEATIRPAAIPNGVTLEFAISMKSGHPGFMLIRAVKDAAPDCRPTKH